MKPHRPRFFRCIGTAAFSLIFLSLLATWPLQAAEPSSRNLDSDWQFRAAGNIVGLEGSDQSALNQSEVKQTEVNQTEVKQWHPAQVPGVVQTDLLHNKLIPDPFDRDNEFRLQWIGLTDWEYQTVFQADAAELAHEHRRSGVRRSRYFRRRLPQRSSHPPLRQHVPPLANPREAAAEARPQHAADSFSFRGQKMIPYVKSLPYVLPSISTHNYGNEENIATAPYTRKAPYNYGWDWGPRFMTEGIWHPVRLETWDALRIENFHIHQEKITAEPPWSRRNLTSKPASPPPQRSFWHTTIFLEHSPGTTDSRWNPAAATRRRHESRFISDPYRHTQALVSGRIRRAEIATVSPPRFVSDKKTDASPCGSQKPACARSNCAAFPTMGKEFRVCREWHSRFMPKAQTSFPSTAFPTASLPRFIARFCRPPRRAHEYGSRMGRRLL